MLCSNKTSLGYFFIKVALVIIIIIMKALPGKYMSFVPYSQLYRSTRAVTLFQNSRKLLLFLVWHKSHTNKILSMHQMLHSRDTCMNVLYLIFVAFSISSFLSLDYSTKFPSFYVFRLRAFNCLTWQSFISSVISQQRWWRRQCKFFENVPESLYISFSIGNIISKIINKIS